MKRWLWLAVFFCLATLASSAAQRPMNFDDVLALKSVSNPHLSPDGRWVLYTVVEADLKENKRKSTLWRVSVDAGPARKLAAFDGFARWSPDGQRIAFLSRRSGKPQIYLLWADGGEAEKLTDSTSPITAFDWSPDGQRIVYVASEPLTKEEEKKKKERDDAKLFLQDYRMSHLWIVEVESKETLRLTRGKKMTSSDPRWSPDGRHIAFVARPTPHADDRSLSDIWIVALAGGAPWRFTTNAGPDSSPRWSPDSREVAYVSRDGRLPMVGVSRLVVAPLQDGEARARNLTARVDASPRNIAWSADGKTLYFSTVTRTTTQIFSVPAAGGSVRQLSHVDAALFGLEVGREGMVFLQTDPTHPAEVFYSPLDTFAPRRLTQTNLQVKDFQLGRVETVRWQSREGMEIEGLVVYPVGYEPDQRYPLLVRVHGGPSGVYLKSFYASWGNAGQVWAGRDWVSFYPNFRGSSGYGEQFLQANFNDWGRGDFDDIMSGIDSLITQGIADPDKVALTGWSYGGYMAAWSITQTDRYQAAVVGAGLTNMFSMYSTNDLQRVLEAYFGGQPWDSLEAYRNASAMNFIKRVKTPTLILHGEEDRRVPRSQAQELRMGLLKNGVPVAMVVYPRAGHGLREPRHQLDKLKREYAWIAKYTLGEPPPETRAKPRTVPVAKFEKLARTICDRLGLEPGERVLLHSDPSYYPELTEALRQEIHRRGAIQVAHLTFARPELARLRESENLRQDKDYAVREDEIVRQLFEVSDVYVWLPMRALTGQLRTERFLENWKGRAIHFHWVFDPDNLAADLVAQLVELYEHAVEVDPAVLAATQDTLISRLRAGTIRITTPAGTDLTLSVAGRRFHNNDGIATKERVATARSVRDREIELPAGALRVIPLEDSATGTLVAPEIAAGGKMFKHLRLAFTAGRLSDASGPEAQDFLERWRNETGDRDRIGELVFGTNPKLTRIAGSDFLPYFGYGAGVVRVVLGDNWESGGRNRSSFHAWVMLGDATVEAGGMKVIERGRLIEP
ncbi:MAG: prolyl oligopeptidase family serine peptidase [Terriglobia bacterium]